MLHNIGDYHTHTTRCRHAVGSMEEYVEAAIAAGLREIGFSDHIPMYWLPVERRDPTIAMPMEELQAYVEDVIRLRERYPAFPIRLGLEADFIPGYEENLARILEPYPWDYVIGSVHFIGEWGFDDPRTVQRYGEWEISELYARCFELEAMAAKSGLFDFLAHIDVVKKFGHRPTHDISHMYEQLADAVASAGVAVELSTAGRRKPVKEVYPHPSLLRELCVRGVPIVISSDSHKPQDVAWGFAEARELALQIGYTHVARFEGRQRYLEAL